MAEKNQKQRDDNDHEEHHRIQFAYEQSGELTDIELSRLEQKQLRNNTETNNEQGEAFKEEDQ
ncbi:hypothetical protein [Marininema halotolerans]|uniref:Uncharacterized protein n=1 Tax=Marininema halotolerans TaxID=1155944 RepID=A0A1I6Q3G2_9BACL|nr:hypothetical protein [Marininema halotolerans]SFS47006.1 hypothetical protein SAMN05444972_102312 [Marininema halotolerans]